MKIINSKFSVVVDDKFILTQKYKNFLKKWHTGLEHAYEYIFTVLGVSKNIDGNIELNIEGTGDHKYFMCLSSKNTLPANSIFYNKYRGKVIRKIKCEY